MRGFPFWKRRVYFFWKHHFEVYLCSTFGVWIFLVVFLGVELSRKNNLRESGALTECRCLVLLLNVFSFEVAYVSWFAASHFISQKFKVFFVYFSVRCLCYRRFPCFLHIAMRAIFFDAHIARGSSAKRFVVLLPCFWSFTGKVRLSHKSRLFVFSNVAPKNP